MKELQSEITINGIKYYSAHAVAERQMHWHQLGIANGMEAAKNEALAEIEKKPNPVEFPTYQHGWSEGYDDGFEEGKSAGYDEGYEIGKKAYGYSIDNIKKLLTDMDHIHHLWYDKGYNAGKNELKANCSNHDECIAGKKEEYEEGYIDGYEQCKHDNQIVL